MSYLDIQGYLQGSNSTLKSDLDIQVICKGQILLWYVIYISKVIYKSHILLWYVIYISKVV